MSVADYNTDPDSNTSISGINIAEGCPPSGINNSIRQMMADIKTADDANVKLSGAQTVAGTKTFTSKVVLSNSTNPSVGASDDAGRIIIAASTGNSLTTGARLYLCGTDYTSTPGHFALHASTADGYKELVGAAENGGSLTWDGKDIALDEKVVHKTGNETVGGTKTFTESPYVEATNPYLYFVDADIVKGAAPTGTNYQGVVFRDKNNVSMCAVLLSHAASSGSPYDSLVLRHNGSSAAEDTHEVVFRHPVSGNWFFGPNGKTDINLGASGGYRWKEVFSVSGAINTSDERLKDNIGDVPNAVLDAWGDVQWMQFQMRDAIEEKGADKARLHNGLVAQRIDAAFKARGLDASRYGLFCHDAWEADEEQAAGDEYSLRYTEALAMEAAYQRRRADRAEARIAALERRLDALEAAFVAAGA